MCGNLFIISHEAIFARPTPRQDAANRHGASNNRRCCPSYLARGELINPSPQHRIIHRSGRQNRDAGMRRTCQSYQPPPDVAPWGTRSQWRSRTTRPCRNDFLIRFTARRPPEPALDCRSRRAFVEMHGSALRCKRDWSRNAFGIVLPLKLFNEK